MEEMQGKSGSFLLLCSHAGVVRTPVCTGWIEPLCLAVSEQWLWSSGAQMLTESFSVWGDGDRLRIQVCVRWRVSVLWTVSRPGHMTKETAPKILSYNDLGLQATMGHCVLSPNSASDFFLLKIWPGSYPSLGLSLPLCMTRQLGWMGRLQGPFIPIARPHPFQNQAVRKTHVFLWKTWVLDSVPEVLRSWGTVGSEDQNGLRSWSVLQVLTVFQTTVDCFGGRQCSLCFPGVWHWKLWSAHLLGRPRWGVRIAPGSLFTIQPWWHSSLRRERPTEEVQLECGDGA
jgi:hypothetical protein